MGTPIQLPSVGDLGIQMAWQREVSQMYWPEVELIRLDRGRTQEHFLYRDTSERVFQDPVKVRAYIDHSPSKQRLMKYGIDEQREVLVYFSTVVLSDMGILENNSQFLIGDLIRFDDDLYEILTQHRDKAGYWANTNVPLLFICTCNRFRKSR